MFTIKIIIIVIIICIVILIFINLFIKTKKIQYDDDDDDYVKEICPPGVFGNVPHPNRCDAFFMCAGGTAIELRCTEGFEFDVETRSCRPISDDGCTANQGHGVAL